MQRNMRNMRNAKPRGRQLKRTTTGFAQNAAIASRRDAVPQVRKFLIYDQVFLDNAATNFSFGYRSINLVGSSDPLNTLIDGFSNYYEQYRIRKVIARCQVGKGFTNDLRLKSYVLARVDVDSQATASTLNSVQSLLASENCISKTFTERGNVKVAEWRPIQRANISNLSEPILPSNDQWYATDDVSLHTWKGLNIALITPETGILPDTTAMTVSFELDIEFRGRITSGSQFSSRTIFQDTTITPVTYEFIPHDVKEEESVGVVIEDSTSKREFQGNV